MRKMSITSVKKIMECSRIDSYYRDGAIKSYDTKYLTNGRVLIPFTKELKGIKINDKRTIKEHTLNSMFNEFKEAQQTCSFIQEFEQRDKVCYQYGNKDLIVNIQLRFLRLIQRVKNNNDNLKELTIKANHPLKVVNFLDCPVMPTKKIEE